MNENRKYIYIILTAAIGSFTMAYASNGLSVILPALASYFHISNILENWIVYIYLLVLSAAGVPLAKICGRYGLKSSFKLGLIIFSLGSLISMLSFDVVVMIMGRILQAIGATMTFVTNVSMITAEIPVNNRGRALGINVTGVYLGITISPTISGILVQNLSWRFVFLITILLAMISYCLLCKIDDEWKLEEAGLDKIGSVIYVFGIGLLLYGFTILNTHIGVALVVTSLILLAIFVRYELKRENPVYEMRLFKNVNYTTSNIVALIAYLSTYVVSYVLNYHFQYIMALDAQTSGLILISTPVMMLLIAAQAGKLSDRINPAILQLLGVTLITIAIALISQINYTTPIYMIVIAMIIQGIGHGFFSTPNNNIILSSVDNKKDIPTASASVATVRNLGQSFSLGILTVTFAFIMGNVEIQPSNYDLLVQSNQTTMLIITALSILAIVLSVIGLKSSMNDKSH
ncbi:MAG: MFS transporter [Methanosphaera sp.]|nr:MFS transporter [Methanosphaera sp.]